MFTAHASDDASSRRHGSEPPSTSMHATIAAGVAMHRYSGFDTASTAKHAKNSAAASRYTLASPSPRRRHHTASTATTATTATATERRIAVFDASTSCSTIVDHGVIEK